MNKLKAIGSLAQILCREYDAYIVGSAAVWLLTDDAPYPNDVDIIIPPGMYPKAMTLIPEGSRTNKFGGIRLDGGGSFLLDVWAMDLGFYFKTLPEGFPRIAYNPCFSIEIWSKRNR